MRSLTLVCIASISALLWVAIPSSLAANTLKRSYLVNDYGAKGDGVAIDTTAIQAAIDAAAHAGGGVVAFRPGTYLSGSIFVKSHVHFQVDSGVTIRGVQALADYPMMPSRIAGIEMTWPAALINVYEQTDVVIGGMGTIDGDGKYWWDSYWALRASYDSRGLRWAADYDARRPRLIQIYKSRNVRLQGLQLTRSGFWTVHVCYSEQVTIDGITIRNNLGGKGPSTDGIDIDSSRHVLVQHADIAVNDDAICMKAGRDFDGLRVNRPTEDVVVRDSTIRAGAAGFTIGSETSGGFRNIEVYRLTVLRPVPYGIFFKSAHTRGGFARDIRIHDITMDGVETAIGITMNWNPSYSYAVMPAGVIDPPAYWKTLTAHVEPPERGIPHFSDVHIWNIKATHVSEAFNVSAYPDAPLVDFRLDHIVIEAKTTGTVVNSRHWTLHDVAIHTADGTSLQLQ